MRRFGEWLVFAMIAAAALVVVATQTTPRLRGLFPLPIALGAAVAWVLAWLARRFELPPRWPSLAATMLVVSAGLCGYTLHNWQKQMQEWRPRREAEIRQELEEAMAQGVVARQLLESADVPDDPAARDNHRELMKEMGRAEANLRERMSPAARERSLARETSFWSWINNRPLRRGGWSKPWPAIFTMAELAFSALLGTWIFHRFSQPDPAKSETATERVEASEDRFPG